MTAIQTTPRAGLLGLGDLSLADVEAVRLLLRGRSVIDWHRLHFADYDDVDRFLRVNEFDPKVDRDLGRLEDLREEAVDYLTRNFSFRIPPDVADELPVRDLFLLASQKGRRQTFACIVLKVMHIIQHLAGRELLFKLPISDNDFFRFVEEKVVRVIEEIRGAGYPIVEFAWSRKERDSLITKLLAKKETLAAHVYDKLRFRLITRTPEDLIPVLAELAHRLIPFNYIVPGESVNDLVAVERLLTPELRAQLAEADPDFEPEPEQKEPKPAGPAMPAGAKLTDPINEFSAANYRIVNFVADLPIRIDKQDGADENDPLFAELGPVVFVLTEFQVVDAVTAHANESGEASHHAYKERQKNRVKARLTRGGQAFRDDAARVQGKSDDNSGRIPTKPPDAKE